MWSDALQISTGLARIRNLSARSEGGRFRAASNRDFADISNFGKQAPQGLCIDRSRRKVLRSRGLGTTDRAGGSNFCCGAAIIVYKNSIANRVRRARLGYRSQNTFSARFLFRCRRDLAVLWCDCLLTDCRAAWKQPCEHQNQRNGQHESIRGPGRIFLFNLDSCYYLNGVLMFHAPTATVLER